MKHFARILAVIGATLLASLPGILASPAVRALITSHPWLAVYYPPAIGVVYAIYRVIRPNGGPLPVPDTIAPQAPTMQARS
jgi:hypothetical protein